MAALNKEDEEEQEKELQFVENEQLEEILMEAYPKIRGKLNLSSYDEKIVFSLEYKQYFINLLRKKEYNYFDKKENIFKISVHIVSIVKKRVAAIKQ